MEGTFPSVVMMRSVTRSRDLNVRLRYGVREALCCAVVRAAFIVRMAAPPLAREFRRLEVTLLPIRGYLVDKELAPNVHR